jgi:hypothetical protein
VTPAPQPASPDVVALSTRLEAAVTLARDWQGRHDRLQAELAKTHAALAEQKKDFETKIANLESQRKEIADRLASVSLTAFALSPDVTSWEEACKACDGDSAEARRRFPTVYEAWMRQENAKRSAAR